MRIAIMGSGGMGGYYGGLLAQRGHDVTFIARGKHLDAIRSNGLQVKSVFGDFQIKPAQATDEPGEVGPVDLVLAPEILPMVAPETTILSLQNGIDATDRIGAVAGRDHMLAGTTWISSAVEEPGVIKQVSEFRRVVAGEPSGGISSRARSVVGTFGETGITAEASDNILGVLWQKFIFIAAASGLGSLTRMPIGAYRAVPETRRMIVALMREVEAVAHARKVSLALDSVDKALEFMDKAGPNIRASMQLDVEAGRRSEIESIIGIIGREGRRLGVPTPMTDMIYGALLPVDLKARGATA
jgi:2-dehydropantoate 2-reductase